MMRLVEALVFLSLATSVHIGLWAASPPPRGGETGGAGGMAELSLAAISPMQSDLVDRWTAPPEVETQTAIAQPAPAKPEIAAPAPTIDAAPRRSVPSVLTGPGPLPAGFSMPEPAARPELPTPDQSDAPRATRSPVRPQSRQDVTDRVQPAKPAQVMAPVAPQIDTRTAAAPAPAPEPQAASRAAGQSADKPVASGQTIQKPQDTAIAGRARALQSQWGARIQRKVHRALSYPRGQSGTGIARVALTLDQNGRLVALALAASSGNTTFDEAALRAVRRAGRFPAAPEGLAQPTYAFTMSLKFTP